MPTDLSVAVARRQHECVSVAHDQVLVLALPGVFGLLSTFLALQSPVFAAALILVGSQ